MDKLAKLMEKKKKMGKELSPNEKAAKMNVLGDLRDMAESEMADRVKGLKKVTVASDSKAGLEKGLDKAKDLIQKHGDTMADTTADELSEAVEGDEMDKHGNPEHVVPYEGEESPEEESAEEESEYAHMSADELEEKIKHLMEMKKKKENK